MKKRMPVLFVAVIIFMFASCGMKNMQRAIREEESQTVVVNNIEFHIPKYFDALYEETDTFKHFYPKPENYYCSLLLEVHQPGGLIQEKFEEKKADLVSEMLKEKFGDGLEILRSEENEIAGFSGWTETVKEKNDDIISTIAVSVAYDDKYDRLLSVTICYDENDQSDYDYLGDYEKILESAKYVYDEKKEVDDTQFENGTELIDGMRPEFVEAMNHYEEFYDKYCEFMKTYSENSSDLKMLAEYLSLVKELEEMDKAFDAWDDEDLNSIEQKYYLEVNNRITKKLLEISR